MRLLLFPLMLLLAACGPSEAGQMPECDSPITRKLLTDAIHNSPRGVNFGLKVVSLGAVADYTSDPADKAKLTSFGWDRYCKATAFTTAGEGDFQFYMSGRTPRRITSGSRSPSRRSDGGRVRLRLHRDGRRA